MTISRGRGEKVTMNSEQLTALRGRLKNQAVEMGAHFFGIADLSVAFEAIARQGGDFLTAFPRAVSVGIALRDDIVDQLYRHRETGVARTYNHYIYATVNQSLDRIALRLAVTLDKSGFRAMLIPASNRIDDKNVQGIFSHKLAARLAGLGWIGPNCLLISPLAGPRARWVTILTDALFVPGRPIENQCGECQSCVDECPPKAFTGRPFDPSEHRDVRFNVKRCIDYRNYLNDKVTGVKVCGMCVHVCPLGR